MEECAETSLVSLPVSTVSTERGLWSAGDCLLYKRGHLTAQSFFPLHVHFFFFILSLLDFQFERELEVQGEENKIIIIQPIATINCLRAIQRCTLAVAGVPPLRTL